VAPVAAPDPYAGIAKDVESVATAVAPDPYAGLIVEEDQPKADPYAGLIVESPAPPALPQLETNPLRNLPPTVMGDVARSAISLGTGLASIPVSTAAGVMDIPGIKQALGATGWGRAAQQTVGSALDTLNANKAILSDEIKKQGGISAEIANNLSSMAADTAANLAMLNVSGFVGKSATIKAAMVDAGKMAALAFVQTPGTTTEKLKQAAIMAAFMLTPIPAGMLPKDWQAKAANIAENLALSAVAGNYGKDVPLAQKIPQVVMDAAFGAVVKGKGKAPLIAEVEGTELEQARIRLGELQGTPAEVSANPEAAALEAKRQAEFVPQGTGESRAEEIARQNEAAGISPRTLEEAPLVMEGKPAGQGEPLPERNLAAKPANKADLDKLYPGRIELFERPNGEIAYLHKDMSPEARKEWLARPESRGDRATQAAGLDTFLSETQPTIKMVTQIQQEAEPFRKIAATSENWQKEFPDRIVQTPIGEVTLGEHQFEKLMQKGRGQYMGLIKPTLENPSMILKDPEGATLFIKAFRQNGSTYFMSVTRSIEGLDVVISNHPKRPKQIVDAIQTGEKLYYSTALKAIAETLPKPPAYSAGARSESEGNIEQPMGAVNRQSEPAVEGPQQAKALITPKNKAELDILYPGRIQLFEHPGMPGVASGAKTGGITYIHKDMTPQMRADWLARPESRGDRATQAAGLDAFMQEGQAPQTSDGATEATVSRPTLPRQIDNAALPKLEAGKPVSQADIRRNLSQALDIPVRLGIRAPGATSGALGIFRAKAETIRMKLLNDLPVLSHEVGHYLHYILLGDLPVRSGQPFERFAGRYDRELIPLGRATSKPSYPEAKIRREGVAEFTRLYLTDSAKSIAVAPEFSAYWKATLEGKYPEINDILKDAQKQIGDYIRQPALVKIKSMIVSSDQAKPRRSVREVVNNLYDDWINQLGPIERTMDWLVKMGLPTEQARLVKGLANNFIGGWRGKTEYALHQASVDLDMKDVGPSLKEILGKVPQLDDFRAYLIAKRAVELNERNKMTGIETADARKVIADLESRYEPIRWELRKFQAQQLKLLVDSGILGKDEAFAMEMMNSMYVPFYRLYEGIGGAGGPRTAGGSGFVNVSQGVRRFKGSDREIIDPLESIVRNAYVFRELAERNKIGSAFVKAVEQVQGGGRVGESVTKPIKAVPINTDEIARIVSQSGLAEEIAKQWGVPVDSKWVSDYLADKKVVAKVWRAMDGMKPKDGIFRIWQNGEEKDFQIGDPELMRALTLADAADATTLNKIPLARWMRYATALKRAGSTLTFEFMGRNPFRDQLTATIYSKFGYIPIVDGFRGMLHALKRDDLYWDWVKHGGRYSDFVSADRTNLQEELANVIRDPNVLQQALSWINPVNVLRNMQKLSEVMETASRLGEYSRGLTAGATPMEAANASKEVTLNFARHGVAGATINKVVAFFNAAVQDPARMAREWKARPKEMLLKNILAITLPSLSLWWLNKDDEEITKLPGWRRTMFWNINLARIPGGPKLIMSFPKPFLEGVLFGTSFEAALDLAWKKDKHAVGDWFDAIQSQIPNPLALDLALPTAEVIANYSFFKGQHIVSSGMERLPAAFQTNPSTSLLSTKVGQLIGISPLKLDFWIKGHFAGMGQYGLDLTDLVLTHSLALEIPPAPAKRISDLPLLRGLRHQPYAPSKYVDYFYSGSQKGEERVAALRNPLVGAKAVKSQWFRQNKLATLWYLGEDEGKLRIARIREIQEGMSDTTRAMSLIQQNMKIEPETKRQKLMKLKDQRDTAAKDALNRYIFPGDR